ncbi:MAG: metal-binding protein [Leptolyngbya sp. SIOISBB]|nr:metal-binding protein [Leptolyngbya sp. SIOISBB]
MGDIVGKQTPGRLVWNHSTHVPGLIAVLEKLLELSADVRTVTPGRLSTVRSNAPKLRLKVSVPIRGGYKLIARKGKSAQEVFVIADVTQQQLEEVIAQALASRS